MPRYNSTIQYKYLLFIAHKKKYMQKNKEHKQLQKAALLLGSYLLQATCGLHDKLKDNN